MRKGGRKKRAVLLFCMLVIAAAGLWVGIRLLSAPIHIREFGAVQAVEDFDFVCATLEERYPYLYMAERLYGFDYEEAKTQTRERMQSVSSYRGFKAELDRFLGRFHYLGHLTVADRRYYALLRDTFAALVEGEGLGGHYAALYAEVMRPRAQETYAWLGAGNINTAAASTKSNGASNNLHTAILYETTAYIRLKTFYQPMVEQDYETLLAFYREIEGLDSLIIDIRGNGGGSDFYWMHNILGPLLEEQVQTQSIILYKDSEYHRSFLEAYMPDAIWDVSRVKNLPALNGQDFAQFGALRATTQTFAPNLPQPAWQGDVYLLVDERVGSSGEAFAMFCSQSGFATLVGSRTGGDGGGHNPTYSMLPNSGLILVYRMEYALNPDGSSNVEWGTAPDYDAGDADALEVCLRLIGATS